MIIRRKTLGALLLALLLLAPSAPAELGVQEEQPAEEAGAPIYALPMDDYTATGYEPDEACFTENGYKDASIEVTMSRDWFDESGFSIAYVRITDPSQLRTGLAGGFLKKTNYVSSIAKKHKAVVATGGEFLSKNVSTYCVRMGVTLRKKGYKSRDILITDENADLHIYKGFSTETLEAFRAEGHTVVNLFNFGPALVIDGELQSIDRHYTVGNVRYRAPRAAIGQLGPLEYVIVVVDGRNALATNENGTHHKSKGITMEVLAQYMADLHCIQAYALDGGGSAVMYFHGETFSTPSSKRSVDDIVYFATTVQAE